MADYIDHFYSHAVTVVYSGADAAMIKCECTNFGEAVFKVPLIRFGGRFNYTAWVIIRSNAAGSFVRLTTADRQDFLVVWLLCKAHLMCEKLGRLTSAKMNIPITPSLSERLTLVSFLGR